MRIDSLRFGLALGLATALAWVVCSGIVWVAPSMMTSMTGALVHADLSGVQWQLTLGSVLVGLICWAAIAAVFGWLIAAFYNRLSAGDG